MNLSQIADNWNGQVTKLYNWTINRLESAADRSDVQTIQPDYEPASVKPRESAGPEEANEIRH